jgi:TRAP-type mannitol/chloroaromatic compound transport system permease small subunit
MKLLVLLARGIDRLNERLGRAVAWLALTLVLVQFLIVVMRYAFGASSVWLQESIVYQHALLFMLGAGYALLHDAHVRIDIFYGRASPRRRALVNLLGVVFFLVPVIGLIGGVGWPYVALSWAVYEGSRETSGIPAIFLLKSAILVFAALLVLQGIALAVRSVLVLAGFEPDGKSPPPEEGKGAS